MGFEIGVGRNKTGLNNMFSFPKDCDGDYKFGKRVLMDCNVNCAGQTLLISTGLRIVNGRHGNSTDTGKLTCSNYSLKFCRLFASPLLFSLIRGFDVGGPSMYSDYCLLCFQFYTLQVHNMRVITSTNPTNEF